MSERDALTPSPLDAPPTAALEAMAYSFPSSWLTDDHHWDIAVATLSALRALPVEQRMEAMGMEPSDGFETFTASDGMRSIRARSDLWAPKA